MLARFKHERSSGRSLATVEIYMSQYIFAYHGGGKPASPEEDARVMAKWKAWMGGLGDALINPGNPVGMSKTVSAGGVSNDDGSNPLSGFSIVKADNMDAALRLTRGCPHLDGGTIEVAEVIEM